MRASARRSFIAIRNSPSRLESAHESVVAIRPEKSVLASADETATQ